MTILRFPAAEVLKLWGHATAAPRHMAGFGARKAPGPRLVIVKDDGIYLMSNGRPPLMADGTVAATDAVEGSRYVVYAEGFNPAKDTDVWMKSRDAAGGDDFAEHFALTTGHVRALRAFDTALAVSFSETEMAVEIELPQPRRAAS